MLPKGCLLRSKEKHLPHSLQGFPRNATGQEQNHFWFHRGAECRDPIYQMQGANPKLGHGFFKWHFQYEKKARGWSFVCLQGIPGLFRWVLRVPKKTDRFYIVICCQKELDCFPSVGFFEDSVFRWQETDWGTLCYMSGLSHFCKCVNVSLNRRC